MMERNQKSYDKLLRELRPILVRHYGTERAEKMIQDMEPIYDRFLAETPSIGGRKNPMNKNMDMALPFFCAVRSVRAHIDRGKRGGDVGSDHDRPVP